MENLLSFKNETFGEIKILILNGVEYFQGKPCALILGYSDPVKAIKNHTNNYFKHKVETTGGIKEAFFLTEVDLYKLILNSKLPYADKFERWIFEDILPSIRNNNKAKVIEEEVKTDNLLIPITLISKDYGMSGLKMNKLLNALKVQYRLGNKWVLYQDYAKEGYTHSKTINTASGKAVVVTYWTEKGREFIYKILKEKLDILPLIELK